MLVIGMRTHIAIHIDRPVFDRFELQSYLLCIVVFLVCLLTTILHLDQFHTVGQVTVVIIYRTSRPAAGDIMEEQAGHISRTAVVLACPFVGVIQRCPICQLCRDLCVHGVTFETVFPETYQTLLVQETTADTISDFL